MIKFKKDELTVEIHPTREDMGKAAAVAVVTKIKELLSEKKEIAMIFAAAPSQNEFLKTLTAENSIDWSKINAFHLDEYIGLEKDAPQQFRYFLKNNIFEKLPFKTINYINGQAQDPQFECERYGKLLTDSKVDIACIGIGENGHIAFNDPHVADFNDPLVMKVVDLDMACRIQQVNDKCFASIDEVPKFAFTVAIPSLIAAKHIYCMVPSITKAQAVYDAINAPISEKCPATILRNKKNSILYVDADSASKLDESKN